jgi:hypothetical protein
MSGLVDTSMVVEDVARSTNYTSDLRPRRLNHNNRMQSFYDGHDRAYSALSKVLVFPMVSFARRFEEAQIRPRHPFISTSMLGWELQCTR